MLSKSLLFKASNLLLFILCVLRGEIFSQWDEYPTFYGYIDIMTQFETDYPELCRIDTIGYSVNHKELLAVKISNNVAEDEIEPSFCYMSTIHGNETVGYILLLRLADYLLSNYGKDERITKLVDSVEIWISPLTNPDGTYRGGNNNIMQAVRYNANGMDLNRNFPKVPGVGDSQNPERETKTLIDFMEPQHFIMSAMIHAGTEGIVYPWCSWETRHPDEEWYTYVGMIYVDLARENSPQGYFEGNPPYYEICLRCVRPYINGWPQPTHGTLIDYSVYYQQCRNVTLELSTTKLLPESQLNDYWMYNKDALLAYLEQVLYGISGTVTDSLTGEPLNAKVFAENHDNDSSWVFSHLPHGDYYRTIYEGTYDVTFSCDGYYPKTITGVEVKNNEATILNVKLRKIQTGIIPEINTLKGISFNNWERVKKIEIYNLTGKMVKTLPATAKINWQEGNGIYIVRLIGKNIKEQFKVIFTK